MGKKYIIEIPEDKITDFVGSTHFLMPYMMAGHIGHHDTGLSIKPYTESDLEQVREEAYQKGYETGYDDGYNEPGKNQQEAYQRGLNDAWDAARNICSSDRMTPDMRKAIFGWSLSESVMDKFTASEAIEKLKAYEQDTEIKVGDEVEGDEDGQRGVVIDSRFENSQVAVLTGNSKVYSWWSKCAIHKTGRHFPEIATVFEKIRNESNEQIDT